MKSLFFYEFNPHCLWIGDLRSLDVLTNGLKKLGHEALISSDLMNVAVALFAMMTSKIKSFLFGYGWYCFD